MIYNISIFSPESSYYAEVTKDKFDKILYSYDFYRGLWHFEDIFSILIENFFEFETELLKETTRAYVISDFDYNSFFDTRIIANQRLTNLLSSCRMYIDQTRHIFSNIYRKRSKDINSFFSKEYDTRLGYRFMESLRNLAQHKYLPVQSLMFRSDSRHTKDKNSTLHTTSLYITIEFLKDTGFKRDIINELEEISTEIELKSMTRDYIGGLCNIHNSIRDYIDRDLEECKNTLEGTIKYLMKYENIVDESNIMGLELCTMHDDSTIRDIKYISIDIIDIVSRLKKKYRCHSAHIDRTISN